MKPIYVAFTMDCERIIAESPQGGPTDWAMSERAISGYATRLLDQGYPPTLFLIPECAARHPELLGKLAERGAELGMHVHPQSIFDHRYTRYLGEYDAEMQREILGLAAKAVAKAVGKKPVSFRPGNFSANDATYDVLYELGFRQGSVSDPGRDVPNFAAVWKGAYLDPHYVDPTDKLIVGKLPFLEVPLTTDPEHRHPNGFPYELRLESGPFESWHKPIIEGTLKRWERDKTAFRALCIFSHNTYAYDDLSEPRTATLQQMLDYLGKMSGGKVTPVTLEAMHKEFRTHSR
jgi:peptidoglycan/xylan/chitin deacetylase (PgdA/CDA1 family)